MKFYTQQQDKNTKNIKKYKKIKILKYKNTKIHCFIMKLINYNLFFTFV